MEENLEQVIARMKAKHNNYEIPTKKNETKEIVYLKNLVSRILLAIILLLCSVIYISHSDSNKKIYQKYIFDTTLSFAKINDWYQNTFGSVIPLDDVLPEKDKPVFQETFSFQDSESYLDGSKLKVGSSYLVPSIQSGIVVFMGEKEGYGNTIIVQGIDGVDIWYGNVNIADVTIYDYIEKGTFIGESKTDEMYLVLQKDGTFLSYEEYQKQN